MTDYVYAKESGVRLHNGTPLHFTENEPWDVTDPFVIANRDLFLDEPKRVRRSTAAKPAGGVERATRRPGEKR